MAETLRDRVLSKIREERERCEKATPGPWTVHVNQVLSRARSVIAETDIDPHISEDVCSANAQALARFPLLPALLAEAERQVEAMDPREYELTREETVTLRGWARALGIEEE